MSNKITEMVYAFCTLVTASIGVVMVGSGVCYGGTTTQTIELQCGENLLDAPKYVQEGEPHTTLALTTMGVREAGVPSVVEVERTVDVVRMRSASGSRVNIFAKCMPSRKKEQRIALTGTSLVCEKGEGLVVQMLEPNDPNPDKFHYVGTLTITRDDDDQAAARAELARIQQRIAENEARVASLKQQAQSDVDVSAEMLAKKLGEMRVNSQNVRRVNSTNPPPSGGMMLQLQPSAFTPGRAAAVDASRSGSKGKDCVIA